jgi:HK97 gp10 family phage protein
MSKVTATIKQEEVDGLIRQVKAWEVRKNAEIRELIERTAKDIADTAKSLAPVESGKLHKSIKVRLDKATSELGAYVVADVFYARFVELGEAPHGKSQPFLHPAYEAHIHQYVAELKKIISSL